MNETSFQGNEKHFCKAIKRKFSELHFCLTTTRDKHLNEKFVFKVILRSSDRKIHLGKRLRKYYQKCKSHYKVYQALI